tara:strand:+ start:377 stop:577 length:201 start_codon:yes stop_codon:yes gene_type:complete
MKEDNNDLLKKLYKNISESENKLNYFLKNFKDNFDNIEELYEISASLEKSLNQLKYLKDEDFSEEE